MKILFVKWSEYENLSWVKELKKQGHTVICVNLMICTIEDQQIERKLQNIIEKNQIEALCTYNFFPVLSVVASNCNCIYIAWVFDSPLLHLYSNQIINSCNYIFLFDKKQYQEFKKEGINTVYHLPLAGDENIIVNHENYIHDITFIGSLYRGNNFYDQIRFLPQQLKGYLEAIMEAQRRIYGYFIIPDLLTDDIINDVKRYIKISLDSQYWVDDKIVFASLFLAKKLANIERESMLVTISKKYKINLYSNEELIRNNINNCGVISYGNEMYQLFNQSKININSTLRCIQSGVNLRTMDILSAGGFCLTNYQEELSEQFDIGKDLIVYENENDLLSKIEYYLVHDDLRKEIANNGRNRVLNEHNYAQRVKYIMNIISLKE